MYILYVDGNFSIFESNFLFIPNEMEMRTDLYVDASPPFSWYFESIACIFICMPLPHEREHAPRHFVFYLCPWHKVFSPVCNRC